MIVSEHARRSSTRRLRACVLACAMVVLPLGVVSAQDYEAVGRRLRAAVEAGELTGEQARAMLGALKKEAAKSKSDANLEKIWERLQAMVKTGELTQEQANAMMAAVKKRTPQKDQDSDSVKAYLMKVKKNLGEAIEAGTITKEAAAKRYEAAEKAIRERMAAGRAGDSRRISREDYARAEAELDKAVAEGRTSPEDARARLQGMRRMMAEQGGDRRAEYEGFERRIIAAVREGKMTREEAGEKLEGFRRRMEIGERGSKRITREDLANAADEVRQAIAEGKITKEQGRAKLAAMRKMIAEKSEGAAEKSTDWEGIKKRIEGAVKSGDLTREQADTKYREIRGQMSRGDSGGDRRAEDEGLERRLRAAVEAGKMTREEAAERLEAYKKNMGRESQAKDRDKELDFAGISRRLQAAVAAGEMTEKEARAKWEAIKKDAATKDKDDD